MIKGYYDAPLPVTLGRITKDHVCGSCRQPETNAGSTSCPNYQAQLREERARVYTEPASSEADFWDRADRAWEQAKEGW